MLRFSQSVIGENNIFDEIELPSAQQTAVNVEKKFFAIPNVANVHIVVTSNQD